jgi:hypothetical protein
LRDRTRPKRRARKQTVRSRQKGKKKIVGAVLVSVFLIALISIGVASIVFKHAKRVPETNCLVSGPIAYTAVLFDATDQVSEIQKISLVNLMTEIRESILKDGAIAIYSVNGKGKISHPEIEICNPGSPQQINQLTTGERLAKKRWDQEFRKPINQLLSKNFGGGNAPISPILEAVQAISVQSFDALKARGLANIPMKLIIVSDLIQNSKSISFYQNIPSLTDFKNSNLYKRLRANLNGVQVEIHLLNRKTKRNIQNSKLVNFWTSVIVEEGGRIVKYKPLTGSS